MRVFIDITGFECSELLCEDGEPVRWNGFVQPLFSTRQMREVIAYGLGEDWEGCDEGWYEVLPNRWMVDGWIWSEERAAL